MDFNSNALDRQVQLQDEMDPKGDTQKPYNSWVDDFSLNYQSEKLASNPLSESIQEGIFYDTATDDIDAPQEDKDKMMKYLKYGRSNEEYLDKAIQDGSIQVQDNMPIATTDDARNMLAKLHQPRMHGDPLEEFQGYLLTKKYNLDKKSIHNKIITRTQKEKKRIEDGLRNNPQDAGFFHHFGTEFIGSVAGWFSDPVNVVSLYGETAALKLIDPLFRMTKVGIKLIKLKKMKDFATAQKIIKGRIRGDTVLEGKFDEMEYNSAMEMLKNLGHASKVKIAVGTATEAGANTVGEAFRQSVTYNFHHEVDPDYDFYDVAKNIGIVAVLGGASGALAADMANKIAMAPLLEAAKIPKPFMVGAGTEVAGADAKDSTKEKIKPETQLDHDITKMSDEDLKKHETKLNDVMTELKECASSGSKSEESINTSNKGVNMNTGKAKGENRLNDRESTMNAEGNGLIRGEKSYNKGELGSGDIARARTGEMSRYKDESIPGSYNKSTWRDLQHHLETEGGFTHKESQNFIDSHYKKNGNQIKQSLRDMGIDYEELFNFQ